MGVDPGELYLEIQRLKGIEDPPPLPPQKEWRLHLKANTPVNHQNVFSLPTTKDATKTHLRDSWRFMDPAIFGGLQTSRTLRSTQLSQRDIDEAVAMGKFERCDSQAFSGSKLPDGWHGVNVFTVPELKGRRRLITEPLLNAVIDTKEIPKVSYPSRLARRQSLRHATYMLQIDFEAFYDAIPIPEAIRNLFVFRKGNAHYRLCTLPTGARWSVAVGQAITWNIVDIDSPVILHTMIDNIMIAARLGEEAEFIRAVRTIVERIGAANLMTSPDRGELERWTDEEILANAVENNTFIGEEYTWNGTERLVRNSIKTVAKLGLAMKAKSFSCRSFVSLVSLILYALHTTRLNPASAFQLLRAYRGVYRAVNEGLDWDSELRYIDPGVYDKMIEIGTSLKENRWWNIADEVRPTYEESYFHHVVVTDASYAGWGAYMRCNSTGVVTACQQKWERGEVFNRTPYDLEMTRKSGFFDAHHSAHAEPRAAQLALRQLERMGIADGSRIALITDHFAIAHAQRRTNGFGGIGRGYSLNKLFEYVNDLEFLRGIRVTFFYLSGKVNPADTISRHFGVEDEAGSVRIFPAPGTQLPLLESTFSPVCEKLTFRGRTMEDEDGDTMGFAIPQ